MDKMCVLNDAVLFISLLPEVFPTVMKYLW